MCKLVRIQLAPDHTLGKMNSLCHFRLTYGSDTSPDVVHIAEQHVNSANQSLLELQVVKAEAVMIWSPGWRGRGGGERLIMGKHWGEQFPLSPAWSDVWTTLAKLGSSLAHTDLPFHLHMCTHTYPACEYLFALTNVLCYFFISYLDEMKKISFSLDISKITEKHLGLIILSMYRKPLTKIKYNKN